MLDDARYYCALIYRGGWMKVLFVNDEASLLKAYEKILKKKGFEVYIAGNGLKALNVVRNYPDIDVAILDLRLPDMSGFDVLQKMREIKPNMKFYISSGSIPGNIQNMLDADEIDGFLCLFVILVCNSNGLQKHLTFRL